MDTGDAEEQLKPHVSVFQPVSQVSADTILDLLSALNGWCVTDNVELL